MLPPAGVPADMASVALDTRPPCHRSGRCAHTGRTSFRRLSAITLVLEAVIVLLTVSGSAAGDDDLAATGPYCGVYSVYVALDALGIADGVSLESLIDAKYVGSPSGSSAAELRQAVENAGGHARLFVGMSWIDLKACPYPLILHVRGPGGERFSHWLVFLGMEDGLVRVLDSPGDVELVPLASLLSRWDGIALAVAREPIEGRGFPLNGAECWSGILFTALSWISVCHLGKQVLRSRRGTTASAGSFGAETIRELTVILGISVSLTFGFHSLSDIGFLRAPEQTAYVAASVQSRELPEISGEELRRQMDEAPLTLIDARLQRSFDVGHIPGAINLPVDSRSDHRRQRMKAIERSRPCVVYCQSEKCRFGDEIALWLISEGIADVRIYRGGWREWNQQRRQ